VDELAFLIDLDLFTFLCKSVPPELLLIKFLLYFKLDILVKLFPGFKLDLLVDIVVEFCPEEAIFGVRKFGYRLLE
jgi:hypothetical protein